MSITYQQAKRIRKTGLMDLFADQLMYEKKIGTAIKKTISLKTRAKVKGVTQYFDPLNIAKVLTFGSSLGPALLGHLMKRDPKDIQYFTGRLKPIRERDTASKISKVPGGEGGFSAEANTTLHKIYSLLSISHEENVKRRELAKNREEEHMLEDDRRHKELIKALSGQQPTATIIKQETPQQDDKQRGIFSMFFEMIKTLGVTIFAFVNKRIKNLMGDIVTIIEKVGKLGSDIVKVAASIKKIGGFLKNKLLNTVIGIANLVGFLFRFFGSKWVKVGLAAAMAVYGAYKWATTHPFLETEIKTANNTIQKLEGDLESAKKRFGDGSPQVEEIQNKINERKEYREQKQKEYDELKRVKDQESSESYLDSLLKGAADVLGFNEVKELWNNMKGMDVNKELGDLDTILSPTPTVSRVYERQGDIRSFENQQNNAPNVVNDLVDIKKKYEQLQDDKIELEFDKYRKDLEDEELTYNTTTQQSTQQVAQKREVPSVRNQEPTLQALNYTNTILI